MRQFADALTDLLDGEEDDDLARVLVPIRDALRDHRPPSVLVIVDENRDVGVQKMGLPPERAEVDVLVANLNDWECEAMEGNVGVLHAELSKVHALPDKPETVKRRLVDYLRRAVSRAEQAADRINAMEQNPNSHEDPKKENAVKRQRESENMTYDEARKMIEQHYESLRGQVVYARQLHGYVGDDSQDLDFDPPVAVRVIETSKYDLGYKQSNHIDSDYAVEPLDPKDPRLAGIHCLCMTGLCVNLDTGEPDEPVFFSPRPAKLVPPREYEVTVQRHASRQATFRVVAMNENDAMIQAREKAPDIAFTAPEHDAEYEVMNVARSFLIPPGSTTASGTSPHVA